MRLIFSLLALAMAARAGGPVYKVASQVTVTSPISPLLASNFVEVGYGYQIEPMMAEMLFNRSFEPYMPYRDNSFRWFGLMHDDRDISKGYETDWRKAGWYHSGYEHNSWFAAPGSEGPFHIDQNSTFFILRSPQRNVEIQLTRDKADVRHGLQALRLVNHETKEWGALAQQGKYLRKGETYTFHGLVKSGGRPLGAEIRFYPQGRWDKPIAVLPLKAIGAQYTSKTAVFRNADFQGYATFSLWVPPGASITVDDFSLMPASNFHGWREDVVEEIRKLKPGLFRFPGGCFASFYNWRDGVGPLDRRPPQPSYFWGGMNYNNLGTDEFAAMCKRVGAEMMFAVNMYHPKKRDYLLTTPNRPPATTTHSLLMPQFTDTEKGAKEAADWVAYCNLPAGRHPMADLRAKNGYREPWGVKYWELDNETFRWFTAEEYAKAAVLYAKAMKAVDPTIRIGLVAYWRDRDKALPVLLEGAGGAVDFLADRNDAGAGLDKMLGLIRDYNAKHHTRLVYANTEWLPSLRSDRQDEYNASAAMGRAAFFDRMTRWTMGLEVFKDMMSWQRRGGEVAWINFNNLSNTHGQSAVETPKEGTFLTACGVALAMIAHSPAAWPLRLEGYDGNAHDDFQVQAAWDRERKRLVLYVLNATAEARDTGFDLSALGRDFRQAMISEARGDGTAAKNTPARPDAIHSESRRQQVDPGVYRIASKPWSFVEVVLD